MSGQNRYIPHSVIKGLHYRKQAYPINLMKAMALVVIMVLLILSGWYLFQEHGETNHYRVWYAPSIPQSGQGSGGPGDNTSDHPSNPEASGIPAHLHRVNDIRFGNFRIVKESQYAIEIDGLSNPALSQSDYELPDIGEPDYASYASVQSGSYGRGYGGDGDDFGLPGSAKLFVDRSWAGISISRELELHFQQFDEPPFMVIDRYCRRPSTPKRSYGKYGIAKLAISIDTNGHITQLELISENPEGYGFGKALKSWIEDCTIFYPGKIGGEKVPTFIVFTNEFGTDKKDTLQVTGTLKIVER